MSIYDLDPLVILGPQRGQRLWGPAVHPRELWKNKTRALLNRDLGLWGPDDLQGKTAQIVMCNCKKLKQNWLRLQYRHIF